MTGVIQDDDAIAADQLAALISARPAARKAPAVFPELTMEAYQQAVESDRAARPYDLLLQLGLGMMASKSPSLFGAVGEAGQAALANVEKTGNQNVRELVQKAQIGGQIAAGEQQRATRQAIRTAVESDPTLKNDPTKRALILADPDGIGKAWLTATMQGQKPTFRTITRGDKQVDVLMDGSGNVLQTLGEGPRFAPREAPETFKPLSADEVKALGLPPGTVAQRSAKTGRVDILNAGQGGGIFLPDGTPLSPVPAASAPSATPSPATAPAAPEGGAAGLRQGAAPASDGFVFAQDRSGKPVTDGLPPGYALQVNPQTGERRATLIPGAPQGTRTVTTAQGVFRVNPDGSLGEKYGDAPAVASATVNMPPTETAIMKENVALLGKTREALSNQGDILPRLDIIQRLALAGNESGPLTSALLPLRKVLVEVGAFSPEEAEKVSNQQLLASTAAFIIPRMRIPGSGASSDLDVRMFTQAVPNLSNSPSANLLIAGGTKQMYQRQQKVVDAMEAWLADPKNKGTLSGFGQWADQNIAPAFPRIPTVNGAEAHGKLPAGTVYILEMPDGVQQFAVKR
jgi:hypothetical protein